MSTDMRRVNRLCDKHTQRELLDMLEAVTNDPANQLPPGSLYKLKKRAIDLTDDIALAIHHKTTERRIAEGMPASVAGYTGRNCNRR